MDLFWNDTVHVSDGLSVHHQEFKTVHTATGIRETYTGVCLFKQTAVSVWLPYVQSWTDDDGRKDRQIHAECHSKINWCIWLVLLYEHCFNACTVHLLLLFCTTTNKHTIISQIITLLHVSTLSCHLQTACNQHLPKLHKYFKCSCW